MIDGFKNPPVENRPRPFWFFNGDMEQDEVRRQILEMKDKGLGGFFLCARQGLRVPYLSGEWFEICKFAVDLARENGLEVWLYDEYPYPSGMSGGEVTIRHPEAKQKQLELLVREIRDGGVLNESLGEGTLLLALAYPETDGVVQWDKATDIAAHCGILQNHEIYQKTEGGASYKHNLKRYFTYGPSRELRWKPESGSWRIVLAFTREIGAFKYYGTFMDPANEDAVQSFIDTTYEPYKAALGKDFSKTVKGMFGDETSFLGRWSWSEQLPEYFHKKYGYNLIENFGALIDASYPHAKRIRYQYFQCAHELLRDRYHKPLSRWCEKNGIRYVTEVPSVRMSNQMYSHVPGGDPCHDKLGYRFEDVIDRDFQVLRQNPKVISAMARQFGRRDSLIEAFHSIGWTKTLQDAKWQIDRQTLMGISLHNFHAYYYTMNGITKHDAPPSQFVQNPYWEYYKTFADYCGHSSRFITETEASTSVAILHPAMVWCTQLRHPFHRFGYIGKDTAEEARGQKLLDDYKYICKTLFFNQIDYDDLDPEVMAMGKIEKGAIIVGRAKYTTLVVPPYSCIEEYAFKLIRNFAESGGRLVFTGLTPFEVIEDGFDPAAAFEDAGFGTLSAEEYFGSPGKVLVNKKSGSLALLSAPGGLAAGKAGAGLAELIRGFAPNSAEALIPEQFKEDIITHRRENNDARFIMLASQNGVSADTKVVFRDCPLGASFYELDLETGSVYAAAAEKTGDGYVIDAPLLPWSARIFAMAHKTVTADTGISAIKVLTRPPEKTLKLELNLEKAMKVSITGGNVYRLEDLTVSIGGGPAFSSKPNTFIEHFRQARSFQTGQIKFSDGFGLPQRLSVNYPLPAAYHFEFTLNSDFVPAKVFLMRDRMAIMGEHSITVNGRELPASAFKPCHVYDQNNIAADVTAYLSGGPNTIDVNLTAARDWDGVSDPMFLLGDFGVLRSNGKFVIGKAPVSAVPTAKAVDGYPFYSGKFTFETELQIDNLNGSELFTIGIPEAYRIYECIELSINGHKLGVRTFSPYIWQGSAAWLKKGENQVIMTIANTLGNMLEGCYYDYEAQRTVYIRQ
ncbi:glycoside hydrolase [Spirochaetia bacterium]|nr:glycoside hydrolase [Spirochaetia bacterium]